MHVGLLTTHAHGWVAHCDSHAPLPPARGFTPGEDLVRSDRLGSEEDGAGVTAVSRAGVS